MVLATALLAAGVSMPARAAEAGGGTLNGGISYRPSLPQTTCTATTWSYDTGLPQNLTLAVGDHRFTGFFSMGAKGSSSCESAQAGSGALTVFGTGGDPTQPMTVLRCPGLAGTYTRVESAFVATVSGSCTFPDGATVPLTAVLTGAWRINNVGFDASVYGAALYGAIAFTG
jgi:hypothetical protein